MDNIKGTNPDLTTAGAIDVEKERKNEQIPNHRTVPNTNEKKIINLVLFARKTNKETSTSKTINYDPLPHLKTHAPPLLSVIGYTPATLTCRV